MALTGLGLTDLNLLSGMKGLEGFVQMFGEQPSP